MDESLLQQLAQLARKGDMADAYDLARKIATREPENFQAWMWMAYVAQNEDDKRAALHRGLALRPGDVSVRNNLLRLLSARHIQKAAQRGVFMSYARADELFTVELTDGLRASGIDAWMDMNEISVDSTWYSSVARALTDSGLMLLVLSPEALGSAELQSERSWFLETGKIIVPLLHKTCDYTRLNLLSPIIDFRDDFALGLHQLLRLLNGEEEAGQAAQ